MTTIKIGDEEYNVESQDYLIVDKDLILVVEYRIPTYDYDGNTCNDYYDIKELRYKIGVEV